MKKNKIVPNIWFTADEGSLANLIAYYGNIFSGDFSHGKIVPLGDTPSGKSEMCEVTIFGSNYVFLNTAKEHHPLNDAVSFVLYCEDQTEIDKYWVYFTSEGKESQCGWCIDKYGLRWQVLPKNLGELMSKPNASKVMMKQRKIVIEEYLKENNKPSA
ncbi:VOC family protein [Flavisolibacter nicotianae]|uniref:VOC family protein n=1 Tax=Flavisolibacter nicotianae TaxID=2364882 RepID=UPI000EB4819A|nr:VOC family protein [Flavisolibacter nicotianae]